MSKHTQATPGPWVTTDSGSVRDRNGNHVAKYSVSFFLSEKEMNANGILLAAAPEMLEALKGVIEYDDETHFLADRRRLAILAIIAKAEGRS